MASVSNSSTSMTFTHILVVATLLSVGILSKYGQVNGFCPTNHGNVVTRGLPSRQHKQTQTKFTSSNTNVYDSRGGSRLQDSNNNNVNQKEDPSEVEYVFISMEEAEDSLRRERARYDRERHEMQQVIDMQRNQLRQLVDRRDHVADRAAAAAGGHRSSYHQYAGGSQQRHYGQHHGLVQPDPAYTSSNERSTSVPSSSLSSSNTSPHTQAMMWGDIEGGLQQQETYQEQIKNIEKQLRHVTQDNDRLRQKLQEHHHELEMEKVQYQDRIHEERERLQHLQEELSMERAYFETSRKLLENLLETEQKKVIGLQEELLDRDLMGRQFSHFGNNNHNNKNNNIGRIHPEFAYQNHNGSSNSSNNNNNGKRRRLSRIDGLEMDMNDIRTPLYP